MLRENASPKSKNEPDFYPCMDDIFLLRYLRLRKFNTEKAFKSLKEFYEYKAQYSGIISDLLPPNVKHFLDVGESSILEHRNKDGAGIFVCCEGHYDTKKFSSDGRLAFTSIATGVGLEVEATQIAGYSVILDFDGYNLPKANHFGNPKAIYRAITMLLKTIPCRIKSYHIVNEASVIHGLLNAAMYLVPTKLRGRLHFHGSDLKGLHNYISPEIQPEEYGGQQGPLKKYAEVFGKLVLSREDHFKEMNEYGYRGKTLEQLKK